MPAALGPLISVKIKHMSGGTGIRFGLTIKKGEKN